VKIKVCHEGGEVETLEFVSPLVVHEGKHLNSIRSNDGLDHYFTQEGEYDGWGCGFVRSTTASANESIESIEAMRQIEVHRKEG